MTTLAQQMLTADDLLSMHSEGIHGELIRGVLHETMPPGERHGVYTAKLTIRLGSFVELQELGEVTAGDAGIWIERDPDTVRGPDIAFFSNERLGGRPLRPGYSIAIPNLVVEIVSPNDKTHEVYDKARMWLSHGVQLVWVVNPQTRTVDVHCAQQPVAVIDESGALDGADVLPGFSCPLSGIFLPAE